MRAAECQAWNILLVDADQEDYILTRQLLNQIPAHEVFLTWAASASAARQALLSQAFDAVLVENDLGDQTGIELIRAFTAQEYPAPFILFTHQYSREIDLQAMQAGAALVLAKQEASPALLERLIRYAIEGKRAALTRPGYQADSLRMDEALRRSELRFQGLFDRIQEAFFVCEILRDETGAPVDLRFLEANPAFVRLAGSQSETDLIGRTYLSHFHPNPTFAEWLACFDRVVKTGQPNHFEQFGEATGRFFDVIAYSPNPGLCAVLLTDITERKQVALQLQSAHLQTIEILESISDAFYSLDTQGRFTYVNRKAASLWDKQPEELLGKNIWEVFPAGKETESYQRIQGVLEDRQPVQYESYSAYLDQWVDIHLYPTEQGLAVYFQDITHRKREEQILANYARDLERSNRDLQEFAYASSHDLQEPLRKIEILSDLILNESGKLDERQRDYFHRIQNAAQRMRSMVTGLLQLSRLSTYAQPLEQVDLGQIVGEVLTDLEMQIQRSGGVVEAGPLPVVKADALQMRQLFQNLIGNALKFQPPGAKPLVKITASQPSPQRVAISVEDNGIGFDVQDAQNLFLPFSRLVGRSEYEGSGIGLALCRKIVERHGGEITARSTLGQGAAFTVTLPLR